MTSYSAARGNHAGYSLHAHRHRHRLHHRRFSRPSCPPTWRCWRCMLVDLHRRGLHHVPQDHRRSPPQPPPRKTACQAYFPTPSRTSSRSKPTAAKTTRRTLFDRCLRSKRCAADSRSMRATMQARVHHEHSSLIVVIMSIVSIFTAGGNAWFGISAGTLVMMFTYTYQPHDALQHASIPCSQRLNKRLRRRL